MVDISPVRFSDSLWCNLNLDTRFRDTEGMGSGHLVNEAFSLLNTITITGAVGSVSDTTSLLRDYDTFFITYENMINANNNRTLLFQVISGGITQATSYICVTTANTGGIITGATATTGIFLSPTTPNTAPGTSGWLYIANPARTVSNKMIWGQSASFSSTPAAVSWTFAGYWNGGTGAVTGFVFDYSVGNITSGIIRVYGVRNT